MNNFLLKHGLNRVLSEINSQSKKNKQLVIKNFSFIEEEGETGLLKELLLFLQSNELVSFELILACFRVQNFEHILTHFNIIGAHGLANCSNVMLVLSKEECEAFAFFIKTLHQQNTLSQKSLDALCNPLHSAIRQQITQMLSSIGIKDKASLLTVWEHAHPETLLHALELFSKDDEIQLGTALKIAECLESDSLTNLVHQVYDEDNFDIHAIKNIALKDSAINEKREQLFDYLESLLSKEEKLAPSHPKPAPSSEQYKSYDGNTPVFFSPEKPKDIPTMKEDTRSLGKRTR